MNEQIVKAEWRRRVAEILRSTCELVFEKASALRKFTEERLGFMLTDQRKKTNDHSVSLGKKQPGKPSDFL